MSIADHRDLINVLSRIEFWREPEPAERKRSFPRFSVRGEATVEPVGRDVAADQRLPVQLRDISRAGIGLVTDTYIEPGSTWRVGFYHRHLLIGSQVMVVRFCRLIEDNAYLVGGQFVIEPGLMHAVGVPVSALQQDADADHEADGFLSPSDLDDDAGG